MALILKDRVQETTTTTGTGTLTLGGAVTGYQSFSAIGNANTTYYAIYASGGSEWEVGLGTYTASGTTLSRDTVLASSNSGSLVSFSAGTKNVWCDYPAGKAVYQDANGEITGTTINANTKFVSENYYAQSILGGNLRTSGGTSLVNWDGGGSGNVTFNGGLSANPSNKNVSLAPTGTGSVTVNPATAGTINNMAIGGTTAAAGSFTDLSVTGTASFDGSQGTAGQVLTSAGTGATPTWTTPTTGTVTSVSGTAPIASSGGATPAISISQATTSTDGYLSSTDWNTSNSKGSGTVTSVTGTAPVVSSGGTTPAISMAAATTSVSGYLTSTDWNTFNGKQAALVSGTNIKTINTNSILGSGDLTVSASPAGSNTQIQYNNSGALGASSSLTYASSTLTAPNLTASNGIVSNNATVGASFTIASGYNAMSVGPVTVASGQSVTVPSGSRWVVL